MAISRAGNRLDLKKPAQTINIQPPRTNSSPLKNGAWDSGYFHFLGLGRAFSGKHVFCFGEGSGIELGESAQSIQGWKSISFASFVFVL